ncbi:hypothetical protein ACIQAL_20640 [Pseudomonas sp. NPDC088368]|uniref:hypothetical protein n=1 Tax=Pseudomonas sp. NPDC088368 TaxID=3364453 RepID=UPI00383012EC
MIRYPITEQELIARINLLSPKWMGAAAERTQAFVDAGQYLDGNDFWGTIKQVYIELQHEKCAYCETRLQGSALASKVHEVEHYRPKSSVKAWPNRAIARWKDFTHDWPTGAASAIGYFRLAYHHLNYAIACTRCNSTLKANYFPVRGPRDFNSQSPQTMQSEAALLLYPISSVDPDDPEDIITFDGVLAIPAHPQGPAYERAITNIEFFQLNSQDLTSRRADCLRGLCLALDPSGSDAYQRKKMKVAEALCSPKSAFSACSRAFRTLWSADPARAQRIAELLFEDLDD